jgi:hypothetical protein
VLFGTVGRLIFIRARRLFVVVPTRSLPQLRGTKTFTLFPPTAGPDLYVGTELRMADYKATLLQYTSPRHLRGRKSRTSTGTSAHRGAAGGAAGAGGEAAAAAAGRRQHQEQQEQQDQDGQGGRAEEEAEELSPAAADFAIRVTRGPLKVAKSVVAAGSMGDPGEKLAASMPAFSPVDLAKPDLARFPRFANASGRASHCVVGAGDLLFVPSLWWHEVGSAGDSPDGKAAAVSWWFKPWYHRLGFKDSDLRVIRSEHYAHLHGPRRSAVPCPDNEAAVCWAASSKRTGSSTGAKGAKEGARGTAQEAPAGGKAVGAQQPGLAGAVENEAGRARAAAGARAAAEVQLPALSLGGAITRHLYPKGTSEEPPPKELEEKATSEAAPRRRKRKARKSEEF